MTVGLQTFDESGNIVIDLTSRLCRFIDYFDTTASTTGSKTVSIPANTRLFFISVPLGTVRPYQYSADVKVSGSVITWDYISRTNKMFKGVNTRIYYGYY